MYNLSVDKDSNENKLNSLKVNKTHGPDKLHTQRPWLKYPLERSLIAVFGQRWDHSLPDMWKNGHNITLFKKGKSVIHQNIGL